MKSSLDLQAFTFMCEVKLDGLSPPFRPMRALRLQWSWAFSLVCEVAANRFICNQLPVGSLRSSLPPPDLPNSLPALYFFSSSSSSRKWLQYSPRSLGNCSKLAGFVVLWAPKEEETGNGIKYNVYGNWPWWDRIARVNRCIKLATLSEYGRTAGRLSSSSSSSYDGGEPAVSYKWTGWVWGITGWSSSRLQGKLPIISEDSVEYTWI